MAEAGGGVSTKGGLQGESSSTLPKSTRFSQFSTQTLPEDRSQMAPPERNPGSDTDPNDSDREEDNRAEELQRARTDKRRAEFQPPRRYTIEPGDLQDELLLTEVEDGAEEANESIFAKIQNSQEFIASVTQHPDIWCNAVRNMVTGMIAYQEQNNELHRDYLKSKERVVSLSQQLKEKNTSLLSAQSNEARLRESRTTYRTRNEKLKDDVQELRIENENLKIQLQGVGGMDPGSDDPDDSDREGPARRPDIRRRVTAPAPAPSGSRHSRQITPAGTTTTTGAKSNNKYPDVKDFHGKDDDRNMWDSWKMHLKSKFMMSWELFDTEISKIVYIRDHCKDTAYDIVKGRADLDIPGHYDTAEEMVQDLEQNFGDFDKEGKADAELQNPKFSMGAKDAKETFDAFHARFTAVIAPLDMSEREKTGHLRRLLANRLKYRILDYPASTSYRELVARLRQVDLNLRLADEQSPRGNRGGGSPSTRGGRGGGSSNSRGGSNTNTTTGDSNFRRGNRYKHPQHVADRLRKEGRCFKCLQTGHLPNEADAPCRDKSWLNEKQVTAMLAETGLEQKNTESPPTYEQQLSEN